MLKNITLSAEDYLLHEAREKAKKEKKTLNALFRDWLRQYTRQKVHSNGYQKLMHKLQHVRSKGPYSREDMNERR
jgi:hypothetical protein